MTEQQDWFESWFDTEYYHILYNDRDEKEAEDFMRKLTAFLPLKENSKILDLPCGRGRHAVFLNTLGYDVTGADISNNSLSFAKQFENTSLHFEYHDMRDPFEAEFDAIFNLFTSFGYFDDTTNIQVLKNLKKGLKKDGLLVVDYLNIDHVKKNLIADETITKKGIDFHIQRSIDEDHIIKEISFDIKGKNHHYVEKVKHLSLEKFNHYFATAGLQIQHCFGEYDLSEFNVEESSRLILIAS